MSLMHCEVMLGYESVDARIAQVKRLKELATKTNVPFFMDFGERPSQQYLDGLLAGLEKGAR